MTLATDRRTGIRRARRAALVLLAALACVCSIGSAAAQAAPVEVNGGYVDWGLKESFRSYVMGPIAQGQITVASGASLNPDGTFRFPAEDGVHDADTEATEVELSGSVHFSGHGGSLEMTVSNPRVELDGLGGTLYADVVSKSLSTGNTESYPGVDLAELDLTGITPLAGEETLTWSAIPAVLTANGEPVFGGFYMAGTALDPVTLLADFGPAEPDPEEPQPEEPGKDPPPTQAGAPTASAVTTPPTPDPTLRPVGGAARLKRSGVAVVASASCPGSDLCLLSTPEKVKVKIAGEAFWAKVIAPKAVMAGGATKVKVKLSQQASRSLGRGTARGRMKIVVRSGSTKVKRTIAFKLKRKPRKNGKGPGGGADAVDGPQAGPLSTEPPLLARPASAVDVSGVSVTWHPRDSWVRYASSGTGPGDGILFANGAVGTNSTASPCPDRPSGGDTQLPYSVGFTPKPSWYDPVSGTAGVYGQGSVAFRWAAHGIDLSATDPEIEINGAASRAIFRFSGSGGTPYPNQRAPLVSLDPSGQPTVSNGGKTLTYSLMRGTLTPDGVNVFAGFYTPPSNDEFGCVSVEFTVP